MKKEFRQLWSTMKIFFSLALLAVARSAVVEIPEKKNEPKEDNGVSLVHPYWIRTLIGKYGFKKPAYDDEFKDFARSQGVSDPDVLGQIRDIYDQPVLFSFFDPSSGVLFSSFAESGFNEDTLSPTTKRLLLQIINSSSSTFGAADEEVDDLYKSTILDKLPVLTESRSDSVPDILDAQNKLGITNPKTAVIFFLDPEIDKKKTE